MAKKPRRQPVTLGQIALRFLSSSKYLPTLAFILLFTAIVKAPPQKIPEMFALLLERSNFATVLGWIVAVAVFVAGGLVIWLMRLLYMREIKRLTALRDELQEKLTQQQLQHSKSKWK